ncbi:MAG: hypothetical protein IJQ12_10905 [Lachnospiraceae bacterium]|nr:hypothetical protein [Lachnospiraceae bacterium]
MNHKITIWIIRIIVAIVIFVMTLLIAFQVRNRVEAEESMPMPAARFPVIHMVQGAEVTSLLHGYASERDVSAVRGPLYIAGEDRRVDFVIDLNGLQVIRCLFEVRTMDGENLIEQSEVESLTDDGSGRVRASLSVKDLIDYEEEQMLVLLLVTPEEETIRYYTRMICYTDEEETYVDEHLAFVRQFHQNTFDNPSFVQPYLETDSAGRRDTFPQVTIRSGIEAVTWEGARIVSHTTPEVMITDLHHRYASLTLDYTITLLEEEEEKVFRVTEDYFTYRGRDKMFLIDFSRTISYVFAGDEDDFGAERVELSYQSEVPEYVESEGGGAIAFVNEGRLFVYQFAENRLTTAFGFYEGDGEEDVRLIRQGAKINVLRIDESGNVMFSVTGYMNRGRHEGEVGMLVLSFDAVQGSVEELVFIRSSQSEDFLMARATDAVGYVSNRGIFYTVMDGDLYAINLYEGIVRMLAEGAGEGNYSVSYGGSVFAWQEMRESLPAHIRVMDFDTEIRREITAKEGESVHLIGFIGDDLIYGDVRESDIGPDGIGSIQYPMYRLLIVQPDLTVMNEYLSGDAPVVSVMTEESRMILHRIRRGEDGVYTEAPDDQIMRTDAPEQGQSVLAFTDSANGQTAQITLRKTIDSEKCKRFFAPYTLLEPHTPDVGIAPGHADRFLCIDHARIEGIYMRASEAVSAAYRLYGQVIDGRNRYVYYRGNETERNQIMTLTQMVEGTDYSDRPSMEACLEVMLTGEGLGTNVRAQLAGGKSPEEILKEAMPEACVLNLNGCPMRTILFYVDLMCDYPVMAQTGPDQYVLVIGFNSTELVFFNPARGTESVYKVPATQAQELFEEYGNHFLTYVK